MPPLSPPRYVIKTRMRQLRELDLSGCMGISRDALQEIIRCCKQLRQLTLDGCNVCDHVLLELPATLQGLSLKRCVSVTGVGLALLGSRCHALTKLNIFGLRATTDAALWLLARGCSQLESLDLSWCASITDAGIERLCRCPRLRRLCLSGCERVTGASVAKVASTAPALSYLDVSWTTIHDKGVAAITMATPHLRILHMNWCRAISNDAICSLAELARRRRRLQTLFAVGCHFDDNQAALRDKFPAGTRLFFQ